MTAACNVSILGRSGTHLPVAKKDHGQGELSQARCSMASLVVFRFHYYEKMPQQKQQEEKDSVQLTIPG